MSELGSHLWGMAKQYRFIVHTPEQLWAMVEPADGATAADLGVLLTAAAKTIKSIGDDLKTHSTSVEWDGEGGDAFRKWIDHAALTTLSLGDYSESAGKWLGHAADTLHEVKPQLESLKNSSASASAILDAHAVKATDVGNHDGGPSESSVKSAKTQYDNDRAEAAQLMIKLAQSYSASTEQIGALKAPEFPKLPEQFVPRDVHGAEDASMSTGDSSNTGTAAAVGGVGVAAVGAAALGEASRGASLASGHQHSTAPTAHVTGPVRDLPSVGTSTSLDRAGTLPSLTGPTAAPSSPTSPPSALPGGTSGLGAPPPGASPMFGGAGRSTAPQRGVGNGRVPSSSGPRGPLSAPAGSTPGAAGAPRTGTPGRGVPAAARPGIPGVQGGTASPVRGPSSTSPGRPANGIAGGRPASPQTGRATGAIPRGTVVGGSPAQQSPGLRGSGSTQPRTEATPGRAAGPSSARGSGSAGARMPAHSDGVLGGQAQQPKTRRQPSATTTGTGDARGADSGAAEAQRRGPARGSSTAARKDETRQTSAERPRGERPARAEAEPEQAAPPQPPLRLPGMPPTTRHDNEG